MRRIRRVLLGGVAVVVVLALVVLGIRAVNGWRYPDTLAGGDPTEIGSYDQDLEGITVEHLSEGSVSGFHLRPEEVTREGTVVLFGGSEGGTDYRHARLLAEAGHEVFALFFFGQAGQPATLEEVPLEFFEEVLAMIGQAATEPGSLTVVGTSKGAELALVLSEHYPEIDHVVLFAPSAHRHQGLGSFEQSRSSWTVYGRPLPYLSFEHASPGALASTLSAMLLNYPVSYLSTYESLLERAPAAEEEAARIELDGPEEILVVAGGDDQLWPSASEAELIAQQRPDAAVHVYPEAGHAFGAPEHMAGIANGGTAAANRAAQEDSDRILTDTLASWHPAV